MSYPAQRMRRLRKNETVRRMVRESRLEPADLILPLFAVPGSGIRKEIKALPGNYHLSVDAIVEEAKRARDLGIAAVILFGIPENRDESAAEAYAADGVVQRAIMALKRTMPDLYVISDVCLCEYTSHGHCGVIRNGRLDNDETLELLAKTALSHAAAGADMVAPAAMMDGQVASIRRELEGRRFSDVAIMAYAAKYYSRLYDPFFREGTHSQVAFGDKQTHQMDCANSDEAMREIALDVSEGADIVMVKPGMYYLDVVYRAKQEFRMPLAVYNVSGEYTMIKAAGELGRLDAKAIMLELLRSFKRAGADLILTYAALEIAEALRAA